MSAQEHSQALLGGNCQPATLRITFLSLLAGSSSQLNIRITVVELDSTGLVSHAQATLGMPDRRAAPKNMQTRACKMPSTVYISTVEYISTA